jgi:hypothetical protein
MRAEPAACRAASQRRWQQQPLQQCCNVCTWRRLHARLLQVITNTSAMHCSGASGLALCVERLHAKHATVRIVQPFVRVIAAPCQKLS